MCSVHLVSIFILTLKLTYLSQTHVMVCTLNKYMISRILFLPASISIKKSQRFPHISVQKYLKNTCMLKKTRLLIQYGHHCFQLRKPTSGSYSINAQRIAFKMNSHIVPFVKLIIGKCELLS